MLALPHVREDGMNIVVTGGSRGIGLELVRLALAKENKVLAVARRPKDSPGLSALQGEFGNNLQVVAADFADFNAPSQVTGGLSDWGHVDVLFNNAGILRQGVTPEDFMQSFQVNSVAPFLMTKALTPWLKKSRAAKVVNITSLMGSIEDNKSGGYYAYRASKAALNMINKSLALDLDWLTSIVAHPGWVKTEMGGSAAPLSPAESALGIWNLCESVSLKQSGRFYDYRGKELPW